MVSTMKVTILGSGTSSGVPVVGKNTPVNLSDDVHDRRLRSSIFFHSETPLIVDTGPDFRIQALQYGIVNVSHVLYTHSHYDHIGGLDDLRPLCFKNNDGITCYSDDNTYNEIIGRYQYFYDPEDYFGKPEIHFLRLPLDKNGRFEKFQIGPLEIQPVLLLHIPSKPLYSVGYVFNKKLAYLTDFREIREDYMEFLYDLDILIVGAPLPDPHPNHLSIYEASDLIQTLRGKNGILTHLADRKFHRELLDELPPHIRPAYDGMLLEI
jgi:phosphoribosyl 1,2-cyclic phosphate phosphodiesterase